MKFQYSFITMSLVLAGCGGGSGGDTSVPSYHVSGTIVSQGTLLDTPVCIDLNQNFSCDPAEPEAKSDNAGKFTLSSGSKNVLTSPILARIDNGSNQTLNLAAPGQNLATGNTVNGVTTLIAGLVNDGKTLVQADEIVKSQLAEAGVSLSGSVMSNASSGELDNLEQNTRALLIKMNAKPQGVALLAQNLSYQGKSLASELLTEAETTVFAQEIAVVAEQTAGNNDTGAVLFFTDGDADVAEVQTSYPGQDAEYGFDKDDRQTATRAGFKFVKLDAQGAILAADATQWACTLDERTGLVWENKSGEASSVQHKDRTFVFESATFKPYYEDLQVVGCVEAGDGICSTSQYAEHMNQQSLCGITDWRLPTYQEFYDLLDLGETATDSNGKVYGLNAAYFPQQGKGSPDIETGAIWLDDFSFNNYAVYNYDGALQFPVIATRGADRGYVSFVEVYSDNVERDTGTSWQFPIRLVAVKGQ
ncbi:DUF1566 domain-containing protein [Vibrio sp. CAU 1672]|uniref:Lcl domain-containing protein n=1 Tax=Vibrio sp. CAU 1672 TaxID=3032594 RepID=UPI0023DB27A4|nr:DUF1566 domain-containing protein [Vibrio sp. CAU 1672]MDF2152678.1 DUF1566 domain-containing protein [Vibrio sp. CAU 1672]